MSQMDGSSKICGHMINFFDGFLETMGGTTFPLAQHIPLSPTMSTMSVHTHASGLKSQVFETPLYKVDIVCTNNNN